MRKPFYVLFTFCTSISFSQDTNAIIVDSMIESAPIPIVETLVEITVPEPKMYNNYIIQQDDPIVVAMDSMLQFYKDLDNNFVSGVGMEISNSIRPSFSNEEIRQKLEVLDKNTPFSFNYNNVSLEYIRMYEKRKTSMSIFLARKETYFPIFEELLLKYKLPMELKYLPIVESALKPDAESWAGAAGLWQFMYNTGKRYGLEADSYMDLRRDPYKATEAACKHLTRLYKIYGNWELVLAAYNAGGGNVNKAIRKAGGSRDYWEIFPYLPRETQGYVPGFIAMNYMMNYASDYNILPLTPIAEYKDFDTIYVSKRVDLALVSRFMNVSLDYLIHINPTYYHGILPDKEENLCLYLPSEKIGDFLNNESSIYALSKELKKTYKIPQYVSNTHKGSGKRNNYRVKSGDFLGKIANQYSCKISDIKKWNNLKSNNLKVGQLLVIYTSSKTKIATKPAKQIAKLKPGESYSYYTIKPGDTLWDIAKKYPGISVEDITNHNAGLNSSNLKLGKKIKIVTRS